jgi:hypothetical protein
LSAISSENRYQPLRLNAALRLKIMLQRAAPRGRLQVDVSGAVHLKPAPLL